jgi:sensor histidine kinase YesM
LKLAVKPYFFAWMYKTVGQFTDVAASKKTSIERLNQFFLYAMVPLLGITIPNITNLLINKQFNWRQLILSYAWFILTSYVIWFGNVFILKSIRKELENNTHAYYRIIISYFLSNLLYTANITILLVSGWYKLFNNDELNWSTIIHTTTVTIFSVILVNTIYEIVFLRKEMEDSFLKVKLLETDKIQAELNALKSQIDPHFIFNSLNTLSYLITNKPSTAKIYNETLAKVYRYILVYKDQNLVFLKEELEFVSNYFYLINIRYEQAVNLIIEIPDVKAENYLLTPVSLQILIENAIKHNDFSKKEPLVIHIAVHSNSITVRNRVRKKEYAEESAGIGLTNLKERSLLITGRNIIINKENDDFVVKVPVLKS